MASTGRPRRWPPGFWTRFSSPRGDFLISVLVTAAIRQAKADNRVSIMLKPFSIFGFGFLFYIISPRLRAHVHTALAASVMTMDRNAPYSYVPGRILVPLTMVIAVNRRT